MLDVQCRVLFPAVFEMCSWWDRPRSILRTTLLALSERIRVFFFSLEVFGLHFSVCGLTSSVFAGHFRARQRFSPLGPKTGNHTERNGFERANRKR
jgi:hypothetical protein